MSNRRTFTATVAGISYEIPTRMDVLVAAEKASGESLIEAVADRRLGNILQGVIYAGLTALGVEKIGEGEEAVPLSYEAVGSACDFAETTDNLIAFTTAMTPQTARKTAKNARKGESQQA